MQQKLPKPLIAGILASLATGLVTLFWLKRNAGKKEKTSPKAPQLKLDNPGSQDEFLTSASPSEIG